MWATLRQASGDRGADRRSCSTRASIRGSSSRIEERGATAGRDSSRAIETALQRGRKPRRGPHPAPLRQRGDVGAAHQFLSDRRQRPAEGDDRDQVRQPQDRRAAAAEAALRDLRLFAARRRRAPALRQGRARRHPLVGPAAGFPHRGARPGQGAAGEERRDRAGRRQGRLRAEAAAGGPARGDPGRGHRRLQGVHLEPARRHRQSRRPTASIPPENVVRHDDDDPYLVVAADKGTATFSDIANGIALEHGFWLGDAFASGGSAGYDHKKMGITARGAWEAVQAAFPRDGRRHHHDAVHGRRRRRHVGRRVRQRHAARAHHQAGRRVRSPRHLHRSRTPIRRRSFAERQRLFDLPRSSWQDYDKDYLSAGGGIYSRKAKEITLSAEAQALLGLDARRSRRSR